MFTYKLKNDRYELELPALTYGTANFERLDSDEIYFELLDTYYKHGGRCIDTARVYCEWLEDGKDSSETVVGRWLKERGCRDEMIICTKGGHPPFENMEQSRLSREDIEYDISRSLRVMGLDYIDIYFLHRDDEQIPVSEIMPILNDLYQSGRAHFLGASNWTTSRIEEANRFALENGMEPFRVSQINYSLAHSSTDSAKNLPEGQFTSTANLARLARVKQLSEKENIPPAVIPLGYLNSQPFFVSSVFAASKAWQVEEDMSAQDLRFDAKTAAFLEYII